MRFIDILRRSGRSLLSAKTRTLLTAFAIAVGAFALTLTIGASNGAKNYADVIVKDNFDPTELIVTKDQALFEAADQSKPQKYDENISSVVGPGGATRQIKTLSPDDIERLKALPGIEAVRPAISVNLQYVTRDGQKKYAATAQPYNAYRSAQTLAGTIPKTVADGTVILPEGFVGPLGFSSPQEAVGKTIRLAVKQSIDQSSLLSDADLSSLAERLQSATAVTEEKFQVVAVTKKPSTLVQAATALYLNLSEADAQRMQDVTTRGTANYQKYISANVKVRHGEDSATLEAAKQAVVEAGYGAQSVIDTQETLTQVITVLEGIVAVFGLIAVVASVFGVVNTMYISVLQRTREIGLMKALGMHRFDISQLFLYEAALIGLLGGLLGAVSAVALGISLNPWISERLGLGDVALLDFHVSQLVMLVGGLVFIAILAGLFPARKASKLDPIEALRTE